MYIHVFLHHYGWIRVKIGSDCCVFKNQKIRVIYEHYSINTEKVNGKSNAVGGKE